MLIEVISRVASTVYNFVAMKLIQAQLKILLIYFLNSASFSTFFSTTSMSYN